LDAALSALRMQVPFPFDLHVGDLPPLSEARALAAYYVVTEAVANAVKHARADRITVEVAADGDRVRITVRDDGVGGVTGAAQLVALHDRVAASDGSITVDSAPGRGTTLEVVL
jgi:signal transduction histidine kinase